MYDGYGNMAAQLMRSGRPRLSSPSTEAERAVAYTGFLSYYGRYVVDHSTGKVTHHVEGSTNPNWVSTELIRYYAFSPDDSRLMLSIGHAGAGTRMWVTTRHAGTSGARAH